MRDVCGAGLRQRSAGSDFACWALSQAGDYGDAFCVIDKSWRYWGNTDDDRGRGPDDATGSDRGSRLSGGRRFTRSGDPFALTSDPAGHWRGANAKAQPVRACPSDCGRRRRLCHRLWRRGGAPDGASGSTAEGSEGGVHYPPPLRPQCRLRQSAAAELGLDPGGRVEGLGARQSFGRAARRARDDKAESREKRAHQPSSYS